MTCIALFFVGFGGVVGGAVYLLGLLPERDFPPQSPRQEFAAEVRAFGVVPLIGAAATYAGLWMAGLLA